MNAAGDLFGYPSARTLFAHAGPRTPDALITRLLAATKAHAAGFPLNADATLLVLRYGGPPPFPPAGAQTAGTQATGTTV